MLFGWLKKLYSAFQRKLNSMKKSAVKDQLYGAIIEMMNSRQLFYQSNVGKNHEYSHWTDEGKEELLTFVMEHSKKMLSAEEEILREKAKQTVFETLKQKES